MFPTPSSFPYNRRVLHSGVRPHEGSYLAWAMLVSGVEPIEAIAKTPEEAQTKLLNRITQML